MSSSRRFKDQTRGLSDVVAFALSFGLIITSVAIVSTGGYAAIEDVYDAQRDSSAQSAMGILDRQIDDLLSHQAPRRSVSMNLRGGTLEIRESPLVFTINNSTTIQPNAIALTMGDTVTVYDSGAVHTTWPDGAIMQREAALECKVAAGDVVSLTVTNISGSETSFGGEVSPTIRLDRSETAVRRGNVSVTIADASRSANLWREYFESSGWTNQSGTYWCNSSTVVVRDITVEVEVRT